LVGQIVPELLGNDAELLNLQAEYQFATGQIQAENTLRRALRAAKEQGSRSRLQLLLAETLLRNDKFKESRKEAEALFKSQPNEAVTLLLARLDLAEGKPQAALDRLKQRLAEPHASFALREVGARVYVDLGQQDNARALIDAILETQPSHVRAAQLRIALEFQADKPKEAVQAAEALVKRAPQEVTFRVMLAEALEKTNDRAAAIRSLSRAVRDLEKESPRWMELVRRLEANNANAEALAALETAHKKLPDDALLTAALASRLAAVGAGRAQAFGCLLWQQGLCRSARYVLRRRARPGPVPLESARSTSTIRCC
jgi:predicted Zn-dependent protease